MNVKTRATDEISARSVLAFGVQLCCVNPRGVDWTGLTGTGRAAHQLKCAAGKRRGGEERAYR